MEGRRERGHLLGDLGWEVDGSAAVITGRQRRLLLGLLMLHAPGIVPVARITTALWPGRDPEQARPAVQVQIHRLRRALPALDLPGGRIHAEPTGYALRLLALDLDVLVFRHRHHDALRAAAEGRVDRAARLLHRALDLWHGPPFGGLHPWVRDWPEVTALGELREHAVATLVDLELGLDRPAAALPALRRVLADQPDHDGLRERLAIVIDRCDRSAAVVAHRPYPARPLGTAAAPPGAAPRDPHRTPRYRGADPRLAGRPQPPAHADGDLSARRALLRAADFAERMGGHGQARDCLAAVLAATAPDHPDRARLLVRLADQRARDSGAGAAEAREAARLFTQRGDLLGTVEAELTVARIAWCRSDRATTLGALTAARRLLASRPRAGWPVPLVASLAGLLAVTRQPEAAVDQADAVLRHGERTPDDADRNRLLSNRGIARLDLGDPGGLDDCLVATAEHERLAGWVPVVFAVNAMDAAACLGDLPRYGRLLDRAHATAGTRGCPQDLRYLAAAGAWWAFWSGDRADAQRRVRRWLAHDDGHFLTDQCLHLEGRLQLWRGDRGGAAQTLERLTEQSRRGSRWHGRAYAPMLAAALAAGRSGTTRRVPALVEEAIDVIGASFLPPEIGVELPILMRAAGVPATALSRIASSPWREGAEAYLRGYHHQATKLYRTIGSRADVALCRRRMPAGSSRGG
ncbi:BTAD domain-containing putative transcriptional regulator [Micromonospora mirobrigensis]|uniref:BTAD domain-containing putative transcriptional regulator n=1 Tax=Micromonospora mirobrigensis TaxID=262898 RepID=UPI00159F0DA4|nr:BTAD domain-containing putative transcriptional regulator [Micromonospora mirobrigensis]